VPFACGALFALGLALSGMTDPAKVVGFLDVGGAWDPSLALVMLGAIAVYLPVYLVVRRRRPELAPASGAIDARLVGGAALFGIGWGLVGYCPGPAIVSLASGRAPIVFTLGLVVALALHDRVLGRRDVDPAPSECG
jgi:uncharacterized membrane protein YedE/YeeE